MQLPPPPIQENTDTFVFKDWINNLYTYVGGATGSIPWDQVNKTGSNLSDLSIKNHSSLTGILGSTTGYHLDSAGYTAVSNKEFPSLKIGDVSGGDYTDIETDGTIEFIGAATVWDDLRIEPNVRGTGANNPAFSQWFTNGSGSRGVYLYDFTDVSTANEKEIFFTMQMPHAWAGTIIYPHVHWIPSAAGTNQRPVWGLEYTWVDLGGTFGNTTIIYTNTLVPNDANLVQNKHYVSGFSSGITPSATQDGISSILIGRLFRRSGDASDTFTGTCGLLYIDTHYEINTLGSRSEYTK